MGYPWKDTTGFYPETGLPPGIAYGVMDGDAPVGGLHSTCYNGWLGAQDKSGDFTSCHIRIKVPTWYVVAAPPRSRRDTKRTRASQQCPRRRHRKEPPP